MTVITICRNDLAGVQRTAASIAALTGVVFQWVVVDGASSDGTVTWLRESAPRRADVLTSEPDQGISDAFNKGLALASGEAVVFMNSGDRFHAPEALHRALAEWNRSRYRWLCGGFDIADDAGTVLSRRRPRPDEDLLFPENRICHAAVLADRQLFGDHGAFLLDFRLAMDYELWLRWHVRGIVPQVIDAPIAVFATGGASGRPLARYRELMRARTLHGFTCSWLAERRGLMIARLKQSLGGLRRWPLLYRLKETLRW